LSGWDPNECLAEDLCGWSKRFIDAMGEISLRGDLPLRSERVGSQAHETPFTQIEIHLPERHAPPAEISKDHGMLSIVASDAAGLGREDPEATPFGQVCRISQDNLKVIGKIGQTDIHGRRVAAAAERLDRGESSLRVFLAASHPKLKNATHHVTPAAGISSQGLSRVRQF
jgi:hypothetical protein